MVLQKLTAPRLRRACLIVSTCLPLLVACGGKSAAQKAADAAAQAKAACQVFVNFHPVIGTSPTAQTQYAKASARAFHQAADLARAAADQDPRWSALAASAKQEADAFDLIVRAATVGVTNPVDERKVQQAVSTTKTARPVFIGQCAKADPDKFQPVPSSSPTSGSAATSNLRNST